MKYGENPNAIKYWRKTGHIIATPSSPIMCYLHFNFPMKENRASWISRPVLIVKTPSEFTKSPGGRGGAISVQIVAVYCLCLPFKAVPKVEIKLLRVLYFSLPITGTLSVRLFQFLLSIRLESPGPVQALRPGPNWENTMRNGAFWTGRILNGGDIFETVRILGLYVGVTLCRC